MNAILAFDRRRGPSAAATDSLTIAPLIRRLRRSIVHIYEHEGGRIAIGPIETLLLRLIDRLARADADTLCSLAALDMVTFSKWIKLLRRHGRVELVPEPADRRRRLYRLTERGRQQVVAAVRAVERTETIFLAPLPPRDRRLFMRLFTKAVLAHGMNSAVQQDRRIGEILDGHIDPGTLLRRARLISLHFFARHCGHFDLAPIEAEAVQLVGGTPDGLSRAALTAALAVDRVSAGGIARYLAARGLVEAGARSPRWLKLSARGVKVHAALAAAIGEADAAFLSVLGRDERPRLVRLLRRLNAALQGPADRASATT